MPQLLQTSDLSLRELFSDARRFRIPAYQREYAWERQHARELLDDVLLALAEKVGGGNANPYFLGSILACGPASQAGSEPIDVVDGQQRLITLTEIFACLRDLAKASVAEEPHALIANGDLMRLCLRDADAPLFEAAVQARGATRKKIDVAASASVTHVNLVQNRDELRRALMRLSADERKSLTGYLADHCRVVLIKADDFDYAYQIFLSINDRGKELTVEDIFQAQLLGPLTEQQQQRYAPIIGHIGKYRRENQRSVSRGKTFFSHLAATNGWSGRAIVTSVREAIQRMGGPKPFVEKVFVPMADAYLALSGLEPPPATLTPAARTALEHLQMLEAHGDDDWMATAMLMWKELGPGNSVLGDAFTRLDRFAHVLMAMGSGAPARKGRYGPINKAIHDKVPWSQIVAMMAFARDDERKALRNIAQRLHTMDKATCRLFLLRMDAHVSGRPLQHYREMPPYKLNSEDAFTVEHILPQGETLKGPSRAAWTEIYPDAKHRKACAQYVGNLALVRDSENNALGQKSFAEKKAILLRAGPHPIHLTDALRANKDWVYAELTQRHRTLMNAAIAIWQLEGAFPDPPAAPARASRRRR
jgi:hypothetical protein